jgi:hypothetical protein
MMKLKTLAALVFTVLVGQSSAAQEPQPAGWFVKASHTRTHCRQQALSYYYACLAMHVSTQRTCANNYYTLYARC